ncbi:hypothetical protein [Streptomyces sp. NPDC051776]|uniref:hypothetical protein n=1 Tax=Streptomyces sp. NPDC051776 TaxID=3155414 RepID=UPI00342AC84D
MLTRRLRDLLFTQSGTVQPQLHGLLEQMACVDNPRAILNWLRTPEVPSLLTDLARQEQEITHRLLDSWPQTPRLHHLRSMLVHAGALPPRSEYLERSEPWLESLLRDEPRDHQRLLRTYICWSELPRARRRDRRRPITEGGAKNLRTKARVALEFLHWLDQHGCTIEDVTQHEVDQWLASGSRRHQWLRSFIVWAQRQRLICDIRLPRVRRGAPHEFLHDDDRWRQLRRCLHETQLPLDVRVAGALLLTYGYPISRAVLLTVDHLQQRQDSTYLILDQHPVLLLPSLANLVNTLRATASSRSLLGRSSPGTGWLFPGRQPGRHIAASGFSTKLAQHDIPARVARNTALAALAGDLPAPVLADLMGIHISTAVRWSKQSKRDWFDYVGTRSTTEDN